MAGFQERQADRASLELTGRPAAFLRSELSLARQNRDDLFPPRWFQCLFGTHPTTLERLRAALRWEAGHPAAAPATPGESPP